MTSPTNSDDDPQTMHYPAGGEQSPAYRITVTVWVLMFLVVVCAGLLNYIGTFSRTNWPWQ